MQRSNGVRARIRMVQSMLAMPSMATHADQRVEWHEDLRQLRRELLRVELGRSVGGGADWISDAWYAGGGSQPGTGVFVVECEDEASYEVVHRTLTGPDDEYDDRVVADATEDSDAALLVALQEVARWRRVCTEAVAPCDCAACVVEAGEPDALPF